MPVEKWSMCSRNVTSFILILSLSLSLGDRTPLKWSSSCSPCGRTSNSTSTTPWRPTWQREACSAPWRRQPRPCGQRRERERAPRVERGGGGAGAMWGGSRAWKSKSRKIRRGKKEKNETKALGHSIFCVCVWPRENVWVCVTCIAFVSWAITIYCVTSFTPDENIMNIITHRVKTNHVGFFWGSYLMVISTCKQ